MSSAFERERMYCTAGECLDEAIVVGFATIQANPLAGPAGTTLQYTFTLPLCVHHAHLLRMDNTLLQFATARRI